MPASKAAFHLFTEGSREEYAATPTTFTALFHPAVGHVVNEGSVLPARTRVALWRFVGSSSCLVRPAAAQNGARAEESAPGGVGSEVAGRGKRSMPWQ